MMRSGVEPGIWAMMEGWSQSEWGNWETVMAGLVEVIDLTVSNSQVADSTPEGER